MSQHKIKTKKNENEWGILVIGPVVQSLLLGGMVQWGFKIHWTFRPDPTKHTTGDLASAPAW